MYNIVLIFISILILINGQGIYEYSLEDFNGNLVSLSKYKNSKVIIIVNIALNDGITHFNFRELEELYTKYHDQGLEIIAIVSNDFGIEEKILIPPSIGTSNIPVFNVVHVTGTSIHPLFNYLIENTTNLPLSWNFCKFLIDPSNGKPYKRYGHIINPLKIEADILAKVGLLKKEL